MKSITGTLGKLAVIAAASMACLSAAHADPIFTVTPSLLNVATSTANVLTVDIIVSGLTSAVGGYSFDLNYDGGLLAFSSYLVDPDTKMGNAANPILDFSTGAGVNKVGMDILSGFFLPGDEATLAALQGAGFRLGTVTLSSLGNVGFAALSISGFSLSNYDGTVSFPTSAVNSQVCVSPDGVTPCTNAVPEPTTALLVATALGALALRRKRPQVA